MLVLADGRLHEREGLRAAVRDMAAKQGVCLAFIALDAPGVQQNQAGRTGQQESRADSNSASLMDMQVRGNHRAWGAQHG